MRVCGLPTQACTHAYEYRPYTRPLAVSIPLDAIHGIPMDPIVIVRYVHLMSPPARYPSCKFPGIHLDSSI